MASSTPAQGAKAPANAAQTAAKSNQYATSKDSGVSSSKPAGSATATCPLARKPIKPCDLKSATLADKGGKTPRSVTSKAGPKGVLSAALPASKKKLAANYDMVLETVSDIIIDGKSPAGAKFTAIIPSAEYVGGCSDHGALFVRFDPRNPDPGDPILHATEFHNATPNGRLPAKTWITDTQNIGSRLFAAFFIRNEDQVKKVEFTFLSCGTPKPPETKKVEKLRGLVRVYRNETLDFAISFPPLRDKTYLKKTSDKTGSSEMRGTSQDNYTVKRDASGKVVSMSTAGSQGWINQTTSSGEVNLKTGVTTDKKPENKLSLGVSIKRNNEELSATKVINQWIENYFKFSQEIFSTLSEVQQMIPKVAFSFSCDVAILEGELNGGLGTRAEPKWDSDAYKWVTTYGKIGFDLKLIGINLKFGFGVEVTSPSVLDFFAGGEKTFELIVAVKASLTVEIHLKGEKTVFGPEAGGPDEIVVANSEGNAKLDLYVQAKVTVTGITCDAKAGVEAGLNTTAEILLNPLDIRLGYQIKPGTAYAYFNYPGKRKPSPRWEYKIWAGGEEHKVKLLHG